MSYSQPLSTELALRAFEADCAFSAALVAVQAASSTGACTSLACLLAAANEHGFAWTIKAKRFCELGQWHQDWQATLRHVGGAEESATANSADMALASLLGFPLLGGVQAGEPEKLQDSHPAQETQQPAAAAEDAVTAEAEPEPEAAAESAAPLEPDASTPLSAEQKAAAMEMVKVMGAEQRKAFTISFRDAFKVPRDVKAIAPLIQELQHLHFVDRFTVEAAGGIAP
jgi:predicted protein tyrosine phosphatase